MGAIRENVLLMMHTATSSSPKANLENEVIQAATVGNSSDVCHTEHFMACLFLLVSSGVGAWSSRLLPKSASKLTSLRLLRGVATLGRVREVAERVRLIFRRPLSMGTPELSSLSLPMTGGKLPTRHATGLVAEPVILLYNTTQEPLPGVFRAEHFLIPASRQRGQ